MTCKEHSGIDVRIQSLENRDVIIKRKLDTLTVAVTVLTFAVLGSDAGFGFIRKAVALVLQ